MRAYPETPDALDTAPDDMKPPLPNLLHLLPSWLRPVRKVDCAWVGERRLTAYSDWDLPEDEFEAVGEPLPALCLDGHAGHLLVVVRPLEMFSSQELVFTVRSS